VIFALSFVGMLAAAIAIIVTAPKCPPQPNLDWWQKAVIYHIHPQSFFDTNADGFGDIEGIHEKIEYLRDNLHVNAICIGPMNPMANFEYGYDIVDFNTTCPGHFGALSKLDDLRIALHKNGIKLILDFVPNHSSSKHPWFKSSCLNESSPYHDYYIWHRGTVDQDGNRQPPNNWKSVYGGSAWTFHEGRQRYYYHTYSNDEPDFNLRNENVVAELDASLKLWLSRGVDGFRFIGSQYLVESLNVTTNEPEKSTESDYSLMTAFQPESYDLVAHWRKLLDDFSHNDGRAKSRYYPRVLIVDVDGGTVKQATDFSSSGDDATPMAHLATNKALVAINENCQADCVHKLVADWFEIADQKQIWSNWQLSNVFSSRVTSRISDDKYINPLNLILLTLPGTSFVYYGDELGMKNVTIEKTSCERQSIVKSLCRVENRAPMQWSDEPFAGFTTGNTTWIPVNEDFHTVNVQAQLAHGYGISPLTVFSNISTLRQEPSFLWGKFYPASSGNVFYFIRQAVGFPGFLVATNLGPQPSTVDFTAVKYTSVPVTGVVAATTGYFEGASRAAAFGVGTEMSLKNVHLKPGEGIVVN
jgi:glycosidase